MKKKTKETMPTTRCESCFTEDERSKETRKAFHITAIKRFIALEKEKESEKTSRRKRKRTHSSFHSDNTSLSTTTIATCFFQDKRRHTQMRNVIWLSTPNSFAHSDKEKKRMWTRKKVWFFFYDSKMGNRPMAAEKNADTTRWSSVSRRKFTVSFCMNLRSTVFHRIRNAVFRSGTQKNNKRVTIRHIFSRSIYDNRMHSTTFRCFSMRNRTKYAKFFAWQNLYLFRGFFARHLFYFICFGIDSFPSKLHFSHFEHSKKISSCETWNAHFSCHFWLFVFKSDHEH